MSQKAASGDVSALQEAVKIETEAVELYTEMLKKYPSNGDKLKLDKTILNEMKNCEESSE